VRDGRNGSGELLARVPDCPLRWTVVSSNNNSRRARDTARDTAWEATDRESCEGHGTLHGTLGSEKWQGELLAHIPDCLRRWTVVSSNNDSGIGMGQSTGHCMGHCEGWEKWQRGIAGPCPRLSVEMDSSFQQQRQWDGHGMLGIVLGELAVAVGNGSGCYAKQPERKLGHWEPSLHYF
jgi:hypothetical protein